MEKVRVMKILIVVITLFVVVAFFGLYFYRGNPSTELLVTDSFPVGGAEQGAEIFQALNDLRSIKIDDTVFAAPGYDTLEDFSTTVQPEDKQRPNPYAPVGQEVRSAPIPSPRSTPPPRKIPNE